MTVSGLDKRKSIHSPIFLKDVDPKVRIIYTLCFSLIVIFCESVSSLSIATGLVVMCTFLSQVSLSIMFIRVFSVQLLLLVVVVMLPFTLPGTPIVQLFSLTITQEGVDSATLILLKNTLLTLNALAIIGTLDILAVVRATAGFRFPYKFRMMIMFMVHTIPLLASDLNRIRLCLAVRSFQVGLHPRTWWYFLLLLEKFFSCVVGRLYNLKAALLYRGGGGKMSYIDDAWSWNVMTIIWSLLSFVSCLAMIIFELTAEQSLLFF